MKAPFSWPNSSEVGSLAKAHGSRTLVLHWNGTRWSRVTDAAGTVRDGDLRRVVADGPDDVWAVGSVTDTLGVSRGFVERWDGAAWTETPVASASDVSPQDISAVAPDDAWMVGGIAGGGTMAQHFDGTAWTIVPTPNVGIYTSVLASVTAIDTKDVWAAGQSGRHHNPPLIEHWNGFAWSVVSTAGTHQTTLVSLHADSPDDVWAVGPSVHVGTLIEHWNGVSWSRVWQIPTRGRPVSLGMLGSAGPGELWAGAGARICPIVLSDTGMSPRYADITSPITIRATRVPRLIPKTVAWRVDPYATEPSTIREVSIGLFDSGPLLPGDSFTYTFEAAGTYSIVHLPSEKVGTVGIPLRVRPPHGSVTQVFHLWWGGGVEDVQVKPPGSSRFITWRSQTLDDFGDFGPTDPLWAGPGDYIFRARLRDRDTHGVTDWSPESTVHVRVVAPFEQRVAYMGQWLRLTARGYSLASGMTGGPRPARRAVCAD